MAAFPVADSDRGAHRQAAGEDSVSDFVGDRVHDSGTSGSFNSLSGLRCRGLGAATTLSAVFKSLGEMGP